MSELTFVEDGFDHDQMLAGLTEAAGNYQKLVETIGAEALDRREGLTEDERQVALELNPDVFVPNALRIPEETSVIMGTKGYKKTEPHYIEAQYAIDNFVGRAVAQNLFAVVNSADARAVLPDKTIGLFEVNANRGFARGREDSAGCYGLPVDWLGYVAVDLRYQGADTLMTKDLEHVRIDYLGEPDSWTTYSKQTLERNAARIRIRPARPIENRRPYGMFPLPRQVYKKRAGLTDKKVDYVWPEWSVLSGEYRICRAVCMLHDLTDWDPEDFIGKKQAEEAYIARERQMLGLDSD